MISSLEVRKINVTQQLGYLSMLVGVKGTNH